MDLLVQSLESNPLRFEQENCISKDTYNKTIQNLMEIYQNNLSNPELRNLCRENSIPCGAIPTESLKRVFSKRLAAKVLDKYLEQGGSVGPQESELGEDEEDENQNDDDDDIITHQIQAPSAAPIVQQPRRRANKITNSSSSSPKKEETKISTEEEFKPNKISAKS